jgi:hypothetical protein
MDGTSRRAKRELVLVGLLLVPMLLHAWDFARAALHRPLVVRGLDLALILASLGYTGSLALLAPRRRILPRFALLVVSLLLSALAAEWLLPILVPEPPAGLPWPPMVRRMKAADTMPGIHGDITFTVNRQGLRGPEVPAGRRAINLLCVGGSTTECLYVTDTKSWPWRLQDRLAERLGTSVFVGNSGRSGLFSLHHAYLIDHYEPVSQFDWVIVLCGINDLGAFLHGVYEQRAAQIPMETLFHRATTDEERESLAPWYRKSHLIQTARTVLRRWRADTPRLSGEAVFRDPKSEARDLMRVYQDPQGLFYEELRRQRRHLLESHPGREPPDGLDKALERYDRDLRAIIGATRRRGVRLLLLTQPTLWKAGLPPKLDRLLWQQAPGVAYRPEVLETLMNRYNDVMLRVAAEEGVPCLDLARLLPKDGSVFYDDCHFNISGCRRIASLLCDFFERQYEPPMIGARSTD